MNLFVSGPKYDLGLNKQQLLSLCRAFSKSQNFNSYCQIKPSWRWSCTSGSCFGGLGKNRVKRQSSTAFGHLELGKLRDWEETVINGTVGCHWALKKL